MVLPQEGASVLCDNKDLPGGGWKGADEETANLVAGQGMSLKQVREYEEHHTSREMDRASGLAGPTPPPPSFPPAWARWKPMGRSW